MNNSIFYKMMIVLAGLFFAVMVALPLVCLVAAPMTIPNIIVAAIMGILFLSADIMLVWQELTI